jgi:dihydroxyacid dehydratase/phosphogluconate dehydratase
VGLRLFLPLLADPHWPPRCNKHLLGLGQEVKASLKNSGIIGYQFGTVGVSDGISMGTHGMCYSLQSRDLIADQVETAAGGHHLDGLVVVPGCDKNMPGVLIARQSLSPCDTPRSLIRRSSIS